MSMSDSQRRALDGFSKSLLPKAAGSGIPISTVNRHLPIMRSCVGTRDTALVVARCSRTHRPIGRTTGTNLLLLTKTRLVITTESPVLHRLRLYLNANLHHLADVTWTPEPSKRAVHLAATIVDGVREHFWVELGDAEQVIRMDGLLRESFRDRVLAAA